MRSLTIERPTIWMIAFGLSVLASLAGSAAAQEEPENAWPQEIEADSGAVVTVFQPQVDSLEGNILKGRSAVMVRERAESEPVFGAVWMESRISTDLDTRLVIFESLEVPRVRFPEATESSAAARHTRTSAGGRGPIV